MVNKVILIGNLGRDPEIRHLESGVSVGRFPVATNESYLDKNQQWQTITEWHDIVVWRRLAERAEKQLKKGSLVFVEGKLTHRKWQDSNGNDRYSTEVVANTFRSLDKRDDSQSGSSSYVEKKDEPAMSSISEDNSPAGDDLDDDLPF